MSRTCRDCSMYRRGRRLRPRLAAVGGLRPGRCASPAAASQPVRLRIRAVCPLRGLRKRCAGSGCKRGGCHRIRDMVVASQGLQARVKRSHVNEEGYTVGH